MKKILFHDNQLNFRGTSVSLYNYAKYNEEILGNKSIITTFPNTDVSSLKKFQERFEVHIMGFNEYDKFCFKHGIDYFYVTKAGHKSDEIYLDKIPTLVHCVFMYNEPHGHKYTYISDWLAKNQGYDPETHSVPYIIEKLPHSASSLREKLGISKNKTVLGCYGGSEQFDIQFVKNVIIDFAKKNKDFVFLFMNINPFVFELENIIFLPGTWDLKEKSSFINACDGMIHARNQGETFGCAVAEFSLENKPVITYSSSNERAHIDILGERGLYYSNESELIDIFENFKEKIYYEDYFLPYLEYSPEIGIKKFEKIFLND